MDAALSVTDMHTGGEPVRIVTGGWPEVPGDTILDKRAFAMANPHVKGIRAFVDVQTPNGHPADVRVFLRSGGRTLTETWTFPWSNKP